MHIAPSFALLARFDQLLGTLKLFIQGSRPKTLPAAIAPVAVASSLAYFDGVGNLYRAALCLLVAVGMQLGTNFVNDYADGKRGVDNEQRVGPTRLVGSGLASAGLVKSMALYSFGFACLAGIVLAFQVGPELIVVGALSVLAGWAYTGGPNPYGYLGLGEIFVFIFFGLVATMGTYYAQAETLTVESLDLGVLMGSFAVALLVTNNLRDIDTDKADGKNTLAVMLGDSKTRWLFVATIGVAAIALGLLVFSTLGWLVLGFAGFALLIKPIQFVFIKKAKGAALISVLEGTAKAQLATSALMSLIWLIA